MPADKTESRLALDTGEQFDARRKELLSLVKHLRAMGAQTDLDLPRVTVIGNQSAGKSSVVEAISRIHVPRDAGTCTRCPMECRMNSSSEPWSCQISIRVEFDHLGNRLGRVSETLFGPRISEANKDEIEIALRKAQYCVLNPGVSYDDVISMTVEKFKAVAREQNPLAFSRNVVCVDLQGPDLVDLSFIDLPGIIQNAETETVRLVESMVEDHISGNCIILVTLPMTDDIENQKALQLARNADPDGRRTIGVLTKPDMLTEGSIQIKNLWLDVIEGRSRHKLVHGYYCTRQPDDAQRAKSITPEEARKLEKDFFKKASPWKKSSAQARFGTDRLITTVSSLLLGIINDSALRFRDETGNLLKQCSEELTKLPPAITMEPATYMLQVITSFCDDVKEFVLGVQGKEGLLLLNKAAYGHLKEDIHSTTPNFIPQLRGEDAGQTTIIDNLSASQPFYLEDVRKHMQQSITRELPDNVPFSSKVALIQTFQHTWPDSVRKCFHRVQQEYIKFLINLVEKTFKRHATLIQRLTFAIFYRFGSVTDSSVAIRNLITDLVKKHGKLCEELLSILLEMEMTPYTQNDHYLSEATVKWLARYKDNARSPSSLERPAKRRKFDLASASPSPTQSCSNGESTTQLGTVIFGSPRANSVTKKRPSPDEGAERQRTQEIVSLVLPENSPTANKETISEILGLLASVGYAGTTADDLAKLIPPHPYETEIAMMAQVRGYFQVAYKRIIDNVPSLIDLKFVKAISSELQPFLIGSFELGTQTASRICADYLSEDKMVVLQRTELQAAKARLEEVEKELLRFGL